MMEVIRAKRAGFCMGVALALHKLDNMVSTREDELVATLGDIIHNPQVLENYSRQGVLRLASPADAQKNMAVLIRAHGVTQDMETELRSRCTRVEDATCPRVKNAQLAIASATNEGQELLLYGEADHPEVRGLISYAAGASHIFSSQEELDALLERLSFEGRPIVLAAQTTQDRIIFDKIRGILSHRFGNMLTVLDTICDATRQRQEEAEELAGRVQAMVVVGGKTSGNTRRLAELARMRGVPTVLVETADELDPAFFSGVTTAGLTAGASTPSYIINDVEERLKSW